MVQALRWALVAVIAILLVPGPLVFTLMSTVPTVWIFCDAWPQGCQMIASVDNLGSQMAWIVAMGLAVGFLGRLCPR
jgi:hypothetical protein